MRVSMHDERDGISIERLLQPARSEKRVNFERLAFHGLLDRRIMQQRKQMPRSQARERCLQLQRFVDGFPNELLDDGFSPRTERALPEAATKSFDSGDADSVRLIRITIENDDSWSYDETSTITHERHGDVLEHTDRNRLHRVDS